MSSTTPPAPALSTLGNVHHAAFRCRDAAQTRWFYEELLGLPLAIALALDHVSGTDQKREYMHLFFRLGDGNFLAFFDDPERARPEQFEPKNGFDLHIALEAPSREQMLAWQARLLAAGVPCRGPLDHGFVESIYMVDPNGIQMEITCRTPRYAAILAEEGRQADHELAEWTARTRARKEALFGAAALDQR